MRPLSIRSPALTSEIILLLLGSLPACGPNIIEEQPSTDMPPPALTYYRDAKPLLERYCTECHQEGGIGPFKLTDLKSAKDAAPLIQRAVESGAMPPWMPSERGLPLLYDKRLRPQDRTSLLGWLGSGAHEGAPNDPPRPDIPPVKSAPSPRPDLVLDIGTAYTPKGGRSDDYHCFLVDPFAQGAHPAADGNLYLTNGEVRPESLSIVHHVLIYVIPRELIKAVKAQDAAEPGPGYTCLGDPVVGQSNNPGVQIVLGWEASSGPWLVLPNDTAVRIPRGSQLVIQMHYSLLNYHGGADRTKAVMELTTKVPRRLAYTAPLSDPPGLHIPAYAADAMQRFTIPVATIESSLGLPCAGSAACDLEILGNFPHMHLFGRSISTSIVWGATLVEIPHWNFHWQSSYLFKSSIVAHKGDSIAVECHYDNSAQKQPLVGSQPQAPRDIGWGPGALDEMCLSYLFVLSGGTQR